MIITFPKDCVAILWFNNEIMGIYENFVTEENLFGIMDDNDYVENKLLYLKEPYDVNMNCNECKSFELESWITGHKYNVEVSIEFLNKKY